MTYPISSNSQCNDQALIIEQAMPLDATHVHVPTLDEPITPPNDRETSAVLSPAQTKKRPMKGPSAWMERSSFKSHFQFAFTNGRKIATCKYCGKPFKEGESTGNLSKHITALHSTALKENKVSKMQTLDTMARRSKPLKMSDALTRQLKRNPAALESILLIVEGFLPFSLVNLTTWGHLNAKYANNGFIQSRNTLTKKICRFRDFLDEALQQNLKDTTMVNVQLDIWTSGKNQSFLAVIVSFAPNILNEKSLDDADSAKILLNNSGEAQNAHLLDFISLEDKRHTGKNICSVFMSIMKRHDLVDKLGTITMDNASNNGNFHSNLIYEHFNDLKPCGHRLMGKVRFIRCASHVLNLQFQKIISNLLQSAIFSNAFTRIRKLAKIMRYSTAVNASLRRHNLPLIPYESQTRWIFKWRQVKIFLENYQAYRDWLGDVEDAGWEHLVSRVKDHLTFDSKSIELLTYFVESCKIFDYLNSKFQDNEYNNLPQGIPLYYLLGHFYKCCLVVSTGKEIPKLTKTMDFSYLNGPSTLSLEEKNIVLEAINDAHFCYQNYLSYIQANPLYYVAVMLDPMAKHEQLYRAMNADEFSIRMNAVTSFIRSYLSEENSTRCKDQDAAEVNYEEEVRDDDYRSFNVHEQPRLAQLPESESSLKNDDNEVLEEWHQYQKEPIIYGNSRKEAIAWWYKHRRSYPCLFKLAMALFYTKLSSCDVERCFSLAGRVIRKGRARLHKNNVRTLMILRDRFSNFSYYKKQPISVEDLQDDLNLDWDEDEDELDDEFMPEISDDMTSEDEYSIKENSIKSSATTENIQHGSSPSSGDKSAEEYAAEIPSTPIAN